MPAFWLQPNRSPDGRSRSMSAVSGSVPDGPGGSRGNVEQAVVFRVEEVI